MSKKSMYTSMGRAGGSGGREGGGEFSSGTQKQQPPRDGDYKTALISTSTKKLEIPATDDAVKGIFDGLQKPGQSNTLN